MSQEVVRRFEVHAGGLDPLEPVERLLRTAEREGRVTILALKPVQRPPSLHVRLRGAVAVVATVVESVRRAEVQIFQDFVDVASDAPSDRMFPDPRSLLRISTELRPVPELKPGREASPVKQGAPVRVAIVDSGVMLDHVDLKPYLQPASAGAPGIPRARFIGGIVDDKVTDEDGHGTMLAGTILATANFTPAIRLIPVKFFDPGTRPTAKNAAPAIDFAVAAGADIIELSWEIGSDSDDVQRAIHTACASEKLIVFAAGNQGSNNDELPSYPSHYAWHCEECRARTITVMATDRYDEKAWFSNYGPKRVDLAAPGVGIVSTRPYLSKTAETSAGQSLRYRRYSGTSAASAQVVGAAALLKSLSLDPKLSAKDLKERIMGSVVKRPGLKCVAEGRLDLQALIGAPSKAAAQSGTT